MSLTPHMFVLPTQDFTFVPLHDKAKPYLANNKLQMALFAINCSPITKQTCDFFLQLKKGTLNGQGASNAQGQGLKCKAMESQRLDITKKVKLKK